MHQQINDNGRSLLLGALVDFITYLNENDSPIVVGRDYKPDRVLDAFQAWAKDRGLSLNKIDRPLWLEACRKGVFKDETA